MFGWFKKKKFDEGSRTADSEFIVREWKRLYAVSANIRDNKTILLKTNSIKDFVFEAYEPPYVYHSNSDEFPDCDDFAIGAVAAVAIHAVKKGLPYAPCFGYIEYRPKWSLDTWHAANWAFTADAELWIYEPQSGLWKDPDDEIHVVRGVDL